MPVDGLIEGTTAYETRILFPRGGQDSPPPFTIRIASPLRGMKLNLPEPFDKPADETMLVRGDIRFSPGGDRIEIPGMGAMLRQSLWPSRPRWSSRWRYGSARAGPINAVSTPWRQRDRSSSSSWS